MIPISEKTVVINGMTEAKWSGKVADAMSDGFEILLLLSFIDEPTEVDLARLCAEQGYAPPDTVSEAQWDEYKPKLNLSAYASKEQGINRNLVYLIRPKDETEHGR